MPDTVATNIIVFGRGLDADEAGFRLSRASSERVEAFLAYVGSNADAFAPEPGRVVFSGGWPRVTHGANAPPARFREGSLMLELAERADIGGTNLSQYVQAYCEIDSDSTLENALRTKEAGYFDRVCFTAANPLGLVAHRAHLARIDFVIRRVFGLPRNAVVQIVASGPDNRSIPEGILVFVTRLAFLGARTDASLRRRHQILVRARRRWRSRKLRPVARLRQAR